MDIYLQIAEAINKDISEILMSAVNGTDKELRYKGFIRWGLVERKIHEAVTRHLTTDKLIKIENGPLFPDEAKCTCKRCGGIDVESYYGEEK